MYGSRRYLIIPISVTSSIDFNQVHETSVNTLRLSIDGTKTFVKYDVVVEPVDRTETYIDAETGEVVTYTIHAGTYGRPSIYSEVYNEYGYDEILAVLATEEWTTPMEELGA